MNFCLVIFLTGALSYAAAIKRPNWLKPCSRTDPNFNVCSIESAKYAVPLLINGDRKLGLPSFSPFEISEVELFGQETFKLKLKNLKVYGLEKLQPLDFKLDLATNTVSVRTYIPKIDISADYEIDGRILFLPLTGTGPCKLSLVDGMYQYQFTFELETREGVEYAKIIEELSSYDYDVKRVMFNLENLFNGDQRLGQETNRLLSDGWQELNKELKGSIIQALLSIYSQLAKKIYEKIPYNEIVLP